MPKKETAKEPAERSETDRQAILEALRGATLSLRELSARVSLRERELGAHLEHLALSLRHSDESLIVTPPRCVACDFRFERRERFTKPSRCPRCRSERVEPACFRVGAAEE